MKFVDIPSKAIEFEDGQVLQVSAFRISEYCVTIGDFLEFEKTTGYLTLSERNRGKPFYLNELIEHIPEEERQGTTAYCMSFVDACHYCEWAKVRLPSEAEWLAAAIIDEKIYDRDARESFPFYNADGMLNIEKLVGYPKSDSGEITSTQTKDGHVIVRSGPWYYRESDWRDKDVLFLNRSLVLPEEWGLMNCFRVVAIDK